MLAKYIVTALLQQNRCERFFEVFLLFNIETYIYTLLHCSKKIAWHSFRGLVLNPRQCGDQLAFDNEYKIGRSTTGILCFSQISAGSPYAPDRCNRVWRNCRKRCAPCEMVQHDRFGGGSVIDLGATSMEQILLETRQWHPVDTVD